MCQVVFIYTYAVSGMMQGLKLHNIKQTNVISLASFVSVTFKGSLGFCMFLPVLLFFLYELFYLKLHDLLKQFCQSF